MNMVTAQKPRVRISKRSIAAFREIAPDLSDHTDSVVQHHISRYIDGAAPLYTVIDVNHPDVPTHVMYIERDSERPGVKMSRYAIVRDGCCVTLLTEHDTTRNLRGTWRRQSNAPPQLAREPDAVVASAGVRDASPFPIVIDHQGALADIVTPTSDGIELRLDDANRVVWQLSTSRAAELRDALEARLPVRPRVHPVTGETVEALHDERNRLDYELHLARVAALADALVVDMANEIVAVIAARRAVIIARRVFRAAQHGIDNALDDERRAMDALDARICERVLEGPESDE